MNHYTVPTTQSKYMSLYADGLLFAVTILAAAGWIFSKEVLNTTPILLFLGLRFFISGFIIACADHGRLRQLDRLQIIKAGIAGLILGLQTLLWAIAVKLSSNLSVGAFISSLTFVFIPIIGMFFFGLSVPPGVWASLGVSSIGFFLLFFETGITTDVSIIMFLASAILHAVYFNINQRNAQGIPSLTNTAVQLLSAALITLPIGLMGSKVSISSIEPVIGWLLASIFIATLFRFYLLIKAQSMPSSGYGPVVMALEPVWASLLCALWFDLSLSAHQLLGCLLILSAIFMSVLTRVVKTLSKV
jgi:drug/metabolite transporter (DMT)-like permease